MEAGVLRVEGGTSLVTTRVVSKSGYPMVSPSSVVLFVDCFLKQFHTPVSLLNVSESPAASDQHHQSQVIPTLIQHGVCGNLKILWRRKTVVSSIVFHFNTQKCDEILNEKENNALILTTDKAIDSHIYIYIGNK